MKMTKKAGVVFSVAVGLLMASGSLFAHHSNAVVDKDKLITVTGTVTKFMFVNPHVATHFQGKDAQGKDVQWYAAGSTIQILHGVGWTRKTLQPGDKILVQGHQMRDGRPMLFWRAVYKCNGEQIPLEPGIADEYRTHVKLVKLDSARVRAVCAGEATIAPVGPTFK